MEDDMAELEMANEAEVETEALTDELSDEALDRQQGEVKFSGCSPTSCRAGN